MTNGTTTAGAGLSRLAGSATRFCVGAGFTAVARPVWSSLRMRVCFLRLDLAAAWALAPGLPEKQNTLVQQAGRLVYGLSQLADILTQPTRC